jgi:diguanylate cyclase (GGDEF)-like protein
MQKHRALEALTSSTPQIEEGASTSAELVGWSLGSSLHGELSMSPAVTRKVLGAALGLEPSALAGLDAEGLRTALARMRALIAHADRLAEQAAIDDLTGALRRGTGLGALQREIDRARRVGGHGTVVAFIDVDGLKQLNDSSGHRAGDRLLRSVVDAIRERVRSYDLVFRYGGDEFVCVLVDATPSQAEHTLDDIRRNIAERTRGHTVSVGLALVGERDDAERVVARADAALYRTRRNAALREIKGGEGRRTSRRRITAGAA